MPEPAHMDRTGGRLNRGGTTATCTPAPFSPAIAGTCPNDDANLAAFVRADAARCFEEFLLVPTIRRYAQWIKPLAHPAASNEVALQVLEICDAEYPGVAASLSERYPEWSATLQLAESRLLLTMRMPSLPSVPTSCGTELPSGDGRFKIGPRIASGSSGAIHRCTDHLDQRVGNHPNHEIVVKLLPSGGATDDQWSREADVAARMGTRCGIRIIDAGIARSTGHGYIVMERVEGMTLVALAASEEEMPARHAGDELAQLASALGSLHEQGLCHGDIHASNVMLDRNGNLRLLDYGNGNDGVPYDDVRALCALGLWMTLGYLPPPGTTIPWQRSPMREAVVKAAVEALNAPQKAEEFARSLRDRMRTARIRRNTLTVLLLGLILTLLLYLGASGQSGGPGASHDAGTNPSQPRDRANRSGAHPET